MSTFDRIQTIVSDRLGVERRLVAEQTNLEGELGMDSLDRVELVMAFEEEFNIEIPDEDMAAIATVEDAVKLADRLVAANG
jgi:acyl carrier protein